MRLNKEQKTYLLTQFHLFPYPTDDLIFFFASKINATPKQVKSWFKRYRYKIRRHFWPDQIPLKNHLQIRKELQEKQRLHILALAASQEEQRLLLTQRLQLQEEQRLLLIQRLQQQQLQLKELQDLQQRLTRTTNATTTTSTTITATTTATKPTADINTHS